MVFSFKRKNLPANKRAMTAQKLNSTNKYQFCSFEEDLIGDTEIEMVEKELRTSKTWIPFFWRWLNWRNRNRNGKPRWDLWPQSTKRRKSCYCKLVSEQRFKQKNMDGLMIDISEMSLFLNWTTKGKIPGFLDGEVNYWRREERDVN